MAHDRDIAAVLASLGFPDPAGRDAARVVLEDAGLTNPRKTRISDAKIPRVRGVLRERLATVCDEDLCRESVLTQRPRARLLPPGDDRPCERCGGSDNAKAAARLLRAARAHGVSRIVVVGGSPSLRATLAEVLPTIELRLVDGTARRTTERARADLDWADVVLIWASTELQHKVSGLYAEGGAKVVTVGRRGVSALLMTAADHLERRGTTARTRSADR